MRVRGRIQGERRHTRLSDDERAELVRLRDENPEVYTFRRLAAIYGITSSSVAHILRRERR